MKVLVTGAAGFIGSNFTHFICRERPAWKVTVLDLLTYAGNLENISALIAAKKIEFVRGDIANGALVEELFKQHGFEAVIHFAAESHVDRSIHDPDSFVRTNVLGTQVLINAARRAAQTRFLHVSTDEVYGSLGPTGYFVETTPLDPSSPYSASKAGSDLLVLAAHKTHGLNAIVTRCTNNYGPYQFPEKFIPLFITNALEDKKLPLYGDGLNVRSWLHVEDHCRALLLILERGRAGQIYNIGGAGEAELPNIAVAKMILEILGKQQSLIQLVSDRPAHDRRYAIDYSKLRQELGWEPVITFEQGLRETVSWYLQEQRWWQKVKSGEYLSFYEKNYAKRQAWGAAK